jgi:hypothetical protein
MLHWVGSGLTQKYETRLYILDRFRRKKFIAMIPCAVDIKLFSSSLMTRLDKLECS